MKKWNMYAGIIMALLGLFVIIIPSFWIKVVVILLGLAAVCYGVYGLKVNKAIYNNTIYERTILIKSIASIVIGVLAILFPLAIGNAAWTAMIWMLIIYLILAAVMGFYAAALLKDSGVARKKYFLENLGLIVVAVILILISPATLGSAILRIIGTVIMIAGLGIVLFEVLSRKKEIVVEVSAEDVKDETPAATETSADNE